MWGVLLGGAIAEPLSLSALLMAILIYSGLVFGSRVGEMNFVIIASHKKEVVGVGRISYSLESINSKVTNWPGWQAWIVAGAVRRSRLPTGSALSYPT